MLQRPIPRKWRTSISRVRRQKWAGCIMCLRVFWETEQAKIGDYDLLPVAQLERFGEEITLSAKFAPPSLSIFSTDLLLKIAKEIRDQIAARGRQLEEYKTQRGIHTAEFGSRDMVYLLALRSFNRYIPLLWHLTETRQVHPWTVYGLLRQLIGELSSFLEQDQCNRGTGRRHPPASQLRSLESDGVLFGRPVSHHATAG